jgi:hypothetical protein
MLYVDDVRRSQERQASTACNGIAFTFSRNRSDRGRTMAGRKAAEMFAICTKKSKFSDLERNPGLRMTILYTITFANSALTQGQFTMREDLMKMLVIFSSTPCL